MTPVYTFGPETGQAVSPLDSEKHLLVEIIARLQALSGGASGGAGSGISPKQYSAGPSTFTPVTTDGTVFTLAAGEKGFIQNLDDAAVYVKYGVNAAANSFNFVLKAGTAANDGLGGLICIDDWIGDVSIAAATGAPRVSAWKLTT